MLGSLFPVSSCAYQSIELPKWVSYSLRAGENAGVLRGRGVSLDSPWAHLFPAQISGDVNLFTVWE